MRAILSLLILLAGFLSPAAEPPAPNVTPILEPDKQGAELAARLRNAMPAEPSDFKGTLSIITRDDRITSKPISSFIKIDSNTWSVTYATDTNSAGPASVNQFAVVHSPGRPNDYSSIAEAPLGANLTRPFAGSDFWLCDLGLEFLHWPQQRVLKHEMRRSRSCWVLESSTPSPAPGGYARVVSWVDVEHDGILRAEAFDQAGKLMKEFTLGSLRKVDGRYQLESMKMRDVRTGRESEIKFDLPQK